ASWAYRFCYNQPNVISVLSGMSTIGQVRQNVADYQANRPFSPEEQQAFEQATEMLRGMASVPCTNCRYCVKDCPEGVVIPAILGLLNLELKPRTGRSRSSSNSGSQCLARPGASPAPPAKPCAPRASTSSTSWKWPSTTSNKKAAASRRARSAVWSYRTALRPGLPYGKPGRAGGPRNPAWLLCTVGLEPPPASGRRFSALLPEPFRFLTFSLPELAGFFTHA
ncbi:MAG: hypothetical protein ACLSVD_19670, partial [Eggerthellaceae bacterium]